jgi:CRISPR-associated RAMP protein (TIGR02581 family)
VHKRLVNECLIGLEIKTDGPLLIKSGLPGMEGPDMAPVLTFRQRPKPEPYIPGSSLKGVIRSHAERVARTLCNRPEEWRLGACDPFRAKEKERDWARVDGACAVKLDCRKAPPAEMKRQGCTPQELAPPLVYRDSCPACKIFGNTALAGRLSVPDAYIPENISPPLPERRDGVGIDRFSGGAARGAKFDMEVVINATFTTTLHLTNFEIWQLGLLACVLYDLGEGLVPIGSGKSRGLGWVTGTVQSVEVRFPTSLSLSSSSSKIWGLRALEREENRVAYGYWHGEKDGVVLEDVAPIPDPLGVRTVYRLATPEAILKLWQQVVPLATGYLAAYEIPQEMRLGRRQGER